MVTGDYDDDGNLDLLIVGNSYAPEISSGRDDASIGLFLQGDGKGNFKSIDISKTGFFADRDAKGFATLFLPDGRELMIVANNDGPMQTCVTRNPASYYSATPADAYALITLQDGRKFEITYFRGPRNETTGTFITDPRGLLTSFDLAPGRYTQSWSSPPPR